MGEREGGMAERSIDDWFMQDVLPLEPMLTRFLQRNWRNEAEISDLRQEAYARVYEAASHGLPQQTKPIAHVLVPIPSETFASLDRYGDSN